VPLISRSSFLISAWPASSLAWPASSLAWPAPSLAWAGLELGLAGLELGLAADQTLDLGLLPVEPIAHARDPLQRQLGVVFDPFQKQLEVVFLHPVLLHQSSRARVRTELQLTRFSARQPGPRRRRRHPPGPTARLLRRRSEARCVRPRPGSRRLDAVPGGLPPGDVRRARYRRHVEGGRPSVLPRQLELHGGDAWP
jgi:hypothetical protein